MIYRNCLNQCSMLGHAFKIELWLVFVVNNRNYYKRIKSLDFFSGRVPTTKQVWIRLRGIITQDVFTHVKLQMQECSCSQQMQNYNCMNASIYFGDKPAVHCLLTMMIPSVNHKLETSHDLWEPVFKIRKYIYIPTNLIKFSVTGAKNNFHS